MPEHTYAFPATRKEPLNNAAHDRNAIARFDQVKDVSDAERDEAFKHIKAAAKRFEVEMTEKTWHDLGKLSSKAARGNLVKKTASKSVKKASARR